MTTFVNLVASGLVTGTVYALLSLGVLLNYRVSRVVNLAHGAQGVLATYVFHYVFIENWGLPVGIAFVLTLGVGAAIGAFLERALVGPARREGQLATLVVTVGALLLF